MFRHRKRLISKRLNRIMHQKTKNAMKALFSNFVQSRAQHLQQIQPNPQPQQPEQPIQPQSESIEEEEQQVNFDQQDDDEMGDSDAFSIANYYANLSPYEKKLFKQQNPELPETFFMTKKEKEKYFSLKAQKYRNSLKNTPDRKSKTSKQVQFKQNFVFKPFNQFQKVTQVKKAKETQSLYSSEIHFS